MELFATLPAAVAIFQAAVIVRYGAFLSLIVVMLSLIVVAQAEFLSFRLVMFVDSNS